MTFYKIIQQSIVTDVGYLFLKWNQQGQCMMACDIDDAEFVQSCISFGFYTDQWLKPSECETAYPSVHVVVIDKSEFEELLEQLSGGETIPEPEEDHSTPVPAPIPDPEPEHKMTVQEMRDKIAELTSRVLNNTRDFSATKTYQIGDVIPDGSRVYIANNVIISGETVRPGYNCTETTIADVINMLQKKE